MATGIPNGSHVELKLFTWTPSQLGLNVTHWVATGGDGSVTDEEVRDAFLTELGPLYQALMSEQAIVAAISARIMDDPPNVAPSMITANLAGEVEGDLLPKQTCGIITKKTALIGRANRGRIYAPFPGEASNETDSRPTAGYITDLRALGDAYATPLTVNVGLNVVVMNPVLFHRSLNSFTNVQSCQPRLLWGTQRRRSDYGVINPRPS